MRKPAPRGQSGRPAGSSEIRAPAVAAAFRRAFAAQLVNRTMPQAFELITRTIEQGLKDLDADRPVRREAIEAAKYGLSLGGIGARRESEESAKDLSDMTKEELRAFVEIGQAKLKEAGNATIEGRLSDEVLDMFE